VLLDNTESPKLLDIALEIRRVLSTTRDRIEHFHNQREPENGPMRCRSVTVAVRNPWFFRTATVTERQRIGGLRLL